MSTSLVSSDSFKVAREDQSSPNCFCFLSLGQGFCGQLYSVSTTSSKPASLRSVLYDLALFRGRFRLTEASSIRSDHFARAESFVREPSSDRMGNVISVIST